MGLSIEEYVDELEKERRKMEVFQRELPLCLDLVAQVIERYRHEMVTQTETRLQSNETVDRGRAPFLEEYIPLRPLDFYQHKEVDVEDNYSTDHGDHHVDGRRDDGGGDRSEKKNDWLKTAQLWNENPRDVDQDDDSVEFVSCEKVQEQQQQQQRKTRRCWSPELHRRFVNALEQLGGCNATPKQIREIMKVDDLTNDEVKSHLQKYRLHTKRRPNPSAKSKTTCELTIQTPQVVFSIWMQPNLKAQNMLSAEVVQFPASQTTEKSAGSIYMSNNNNPLLQFQPHYNYHKGLQRKKPNRSPRGPLRSNQAEKVDSCGTLGSF